MLFLGLGIFLFGANLAVVPIGNPYGETITRTNKYYWVGILGFY